MQLECFINDKAARVEWKLNGEPIKVNNTIEVFPLLLIEVANSLPNRTFQQHGFDLHGMIYISNSAVLGADELLFVLKCISVLCPWLCQNPTTRYNTLYLHGG